MHKFKFPVAICGLRGNIITSLKIRWLTISLIISISNLTTKYCVEEYHCSSALWFTLLLIKFLLEKDSPVIFFSSVLLRSISLHISPFVLMLNLRRVFRVVLSNECNTSISISWDTSENVYSNKMF